MPPACSISWNSDHAASQSSRVRLSMPPEPAAGSETLCEVGFLQQHQLRVARGAARERVGQSQRQRVRQHVDAVGAAEPGGECRHRRAQHVHIGVALGQHAPCGLCGDEQRFWREATGLFDPRPQQPQRAEFCHGQELVGIGGKPRIDHALRVFQRNAGALDRAQIGDAGRQHEGQFLHFRSAGVVDHPSVGNRERALETHGGEALDRAGARQGTISGQRRGWIPTPRRRRSDRDRSGHRRPRDRDPCA